MEQLENVKNNKTKFSNAAITLKKMRSLKGLSRKQAGIIFNLSYKTIEKLENGRGHIDEQRLTFFASEYGFNFSDLLKIQNGNYDTDLTFKLRSKKENDPKRKDRRFCTPKITKECKVLRQLREKKGISQYQLSRMCGYNKQRIGFYECGRKDLDEKLIESIIKVMGFTMDDFYAQMNSEEMPYEIVNECLFIMKKLEPKTQCYT